MAFITFEGPDGAGKTTQIRLLESYLRKHGVDLVSTRQPRGTDVGKQIAHVILEMHHLRIDAKTELFLYAADRSQHVEEVIKPALSRGAWVLCDRYTDSSLALQGAGGVSLELIRQVNQLATGGLEPDLTILLDLPPDETLSRIEHRGDRPDRIESKGYEFHKRVREIYLRLAQLHSRFVVIDAQQSIEEIEHAVRLVADQLLATANGQKEF
ncbi:MAG: dTMP kinase [Bacillota bacterium]